MTRKIVIDASAILAVLLNEENASDILAATESSELFSPECLPFEICNCISKWYRRGVISEAQGQNIFEQFKNVEYKKIEPDYSAVLTLSAQEKHYAFDMFYLEAAQKLNAVLLTLDSDLQEIAKKRGVKCL